MQSEFLKPEFFREGAEIEKFDDQQYRLGRFTKVALLERARGQVIKEYAIEEFDPRWSELFFADPLMAHEAAQGILITYKTLRAGRAAPPTAEEVHQALAPQFKMIYKEAAEIPFVRSVLKTWQLPAIAKKLNERHALISNFFETQLPELVVPTQYVVGEGKNAKGLNARRIYSISPEVKPVVKMSDVFSFDWGRYFRGWRSGITTIHHFNKSELAQMLTDAAQKFTNELEGSFSSDELKKIRRELEILASRAKKLTQKTGWIPFDLLTPENLVITRDGVRIIDTNQGVPADAPVPADVRGEFERSIQFWERIAEMLSAAEEKQQAA